MDCKGAESNLAESHGKPLILPRAAPQNSGENMETLENFIKGERRIPGHPWWAWRMGKDIKDPLEVVENVI